MLNCLPHSPSSKNEVNSFTMPSAHPHPIEREMHWRSVPQRVKEEPYLAQTGHWGDQWPSKPHWTPGEKSPTTETPQKKSSTHTSNWVPSFLQEKPIGWRMSPLITKFLSQYRVSVLTAPYTVCPPLCTESMAKDDVSTYVIQISILFHLCLRGTEIM